MADVTISRPQRIKTQGRRQRRPSHAFSVRHLPFVIQPFCIAPVRPGETMVNMQTTMSAYTAPLAARNLGGWLEHAYFYVPVTAMPDAATVMQWFIDEGGSVATLDTAANAEYYYSGVGTMPNWVHQCMVAVVEEYYRGDTAAGIRETWNSQVITQGANASMPVAGVRNDGMADSLMLASELPADSSAPVEDAYLGTLGPLDAQRRTYDRLRLMGFRELTFEEWLETQGISVPKTANTFTTEAKPELLRMHRTFVMPANAINPATGAAASALVWKKEFTGDKDYLFKVPGFVLGVTIMRFKTYLGRQYSAGVGAIGSPLDFLPKIDEFREEDALALGMDAAAGNAVTTGVYSSGVADATSPSGAYIHDMLDLYLQGDQFTNYSAPGTVTLPTAGLQTRYLSKAQMAAFFVASATDADQSTFQDGRVDFTFMSDLKDNRLSVAS